METITRRKDKTDMKHRDKEGITRIPIWITTASPIDCHVDANETCQLRQRIKTFVFTHSIQHRDDVIVDAVVSNIQTFRRPPTHITTSHFAYVWLQNLHSILQYITSLDAHNTLNPLRIPIPQNLLELGEKCLRTITVDNTED